MKPCALLGVQELEVFVEHFPDCDEGCDVVQEVRGWSRVATEIK